MNYSLDDRHRSIRRFVMNALGAPPWKVRTERQPVADEQRPIAVVEEAAPVAMTRYRTSIPQGDVEKAQTFGIALYPAMFDTSVEPPRALLAPEGRMEAARAAWRLDAALSAGLVNDDGSSLAPPRMVPVYDFEGVDVVGPGRAGAEEPYGWLWIDDAPVRQVQDPDDHLRWTVTCDLRVSWSQAGRERPTAPIVGSMPGYFVTGP